MTADAYLRGDETLVKVSSRADAVLRTNEKYFLNIWQMILPQWKMFILNMWQMPILGTNEKCLF